jgi:16S rRNA (adenine1518-N6/adenine1519-N6)-dimethyltransferase
VKLIPYRDYPYVAKDYATFSNVVKHGFGQRRKTLRNSLKNIVDDAVWERISIDSKARPEDLTVKDFVEISNAIT